MRVLVCGGRDYDNPEQMKRVLDDLVPEIELIIEGAAPGADRLAGAWAKKNGIPLIEMPAPWTAHGRRAGMIRNSWMLAYTEPDLVIAFPGGVGTAGMIRMAKAKGIEVRVIDW